MLESIGCQKNRKDNIITSGRRKVQKILLTLKPSLQRNQLMIACGMLLQTLTIATQRSLNLLRLFDKETIFKISKNQPNFAFR